MPCRLRGADAGVEVEPSPQRDLRRQLGAIGLPHVGPAASAQENGVGLSASCQRRIGKIGAAFEKGRGTGGRIEELELKATRLPGRRGHDLDAAGHNLGADAITGDNCDRVSVHECHPLREIAFFVIFGPGLPVCIL